MQTPLVSIIIPVYNGAQYLSEAIDSALRQTYRNTEIIVVNDGSTDGGQTREVAQLYGSQIRYFEKVNGGVSSALNKGIKEMAGEYFSWLSHDDVVENNKTEVQIEAAQSEEADVVYSKFSRISASGELIDPAPIPESQYRQPVMLQLLSGYSLNGCAFLVRRDVFDRVGLFREDLASTQDYDMWMRMAAHQKFVFADHVVVRSRRHELQTTKVYRGHFRECARFYDRSVRTAIERGFLETLSKQELSALAESLLARNYLSAAARACMVQRYRRSRVRLLWRILVHRYALFPAVHIARKLRRAGLKARTRLWPARRP